MYNLGIVLGIVLLSPSILLAITDYCNPELCTSNNEVKPHIGCNHNGEFSNSCIDPAIVPMTSKLMRVILYAHNNIRNRIANGSIPGFETAKRMATMKWDEDLEYLAGLNILKCELKPDECHNTEAYRFSGQNLAIKYNSDEILFSHYESIIASFIDEWFNECKNANQNDLDKCSESSTAKGISHFTAMIQEKSSRVGCSVVRFFQNIEGQNLCTILMACNYSFDNIIGVPVYSKGPMCSWCQSGSNPEFNGLCSVSEHIQPVPSNVSEMYDSMAPVQASRYIQLQPPRQNQSVYPLTHYTNTNPSSDLFLTVSEQHYISPIPSIRNIRPAQASLIVSEVPTERSLRSTLLSSSSISGRSIPARPSISEVPSEQTLRPIPLCRLNSNKPVPAPRSISKVPSVFSISPIPLCASLPNKPTPAPRTISEVPSVQSLRPISLSRPILPVATEAQSLDRAPSIRSSLRVSTAQIHQPTPFPRTIFLNPSVQDVQEDLDQPVSLPQTDAPPPLNGFNHIPPAPGTTVALIAPAESTRYTDYVFLRRSNRRSGLQTIAIIRPVNRFVEFVHRLRMDQIREIVQPLRPIPTPIVLLAEAFKSIAIWFVIPS